MTHDPVNRALTPPREAEARKVTRRHIWEAAATELRAMDDRLQWSWGKWANEGYTDYDLSYDEMAAIARKRRQTLYNRAAVHRAWPEAERVYDKLTWSHYEATYSLPDNQRSSLMHLAQRNGWSVDELREAARKVKATMAGHDPEAEPVRFSGVGIVTLNGEYGITLDIDPATLDMPPTVANGRRFKVTFVEIVE